MEGAWQPSGAWATLLRVLDQVISEISPKTDLDVSLEE